MAAPRFLPLDPPLKVERVEWRDVGGDMLLVRCSGSWAHAAPTRSRPVLVVRSRGRAHRFPALPAPGGGGPGVWRSAFAVPAALRGALRADLELELGGLVVPLPGGEAAEAELAPAAVSAERRAERAERAEREQAERADEAETLAAELAVRVAQLEERLAELEDEAVVGAGIELGLLRAELEQARQAAFAETRRREELEAELGAQVRELTEEREALVAQLAAVLDQRDDLRRRVRELERRGEVARAAPRGATVVTTPPALGVLRRERVLAAALAPGPDGEPLRLAEALEALETVDPIATRPPPAPPAPPAPSASADPPPAPVAAPASPTPMPTPASARRLQPGPSSTRRVLHAAVPDPGGLHRTVPEGRPAPFARVPAPAPEAFDDALARLRAARPGGPDEASPEEAVTGLWERLLTLLLPSRRRPDRRS